MAKPDRLGGPGGIPYEGKRGPIPITDIDRFGEPTNAGGYLGVFADQIADARERGLGKAFGYSVGKTFRGVMFALPLTDFTDTSIPSADHRVLLISPKDTGVSLLVARPNQEPPSEMESVQDIEMRRRHSRNEARANEFRSLFEPSPQAHIGGFWRNDPRLAFAEFASHPEILSNAVVVDSEIPDAEKVSVLHHAFTVAETMEAKRKVTELDDQTLDAGGFQGRFAEQIALLQQQGRGKAFGFTTAPETSYDPPTFHGVFFALPLTDITDETIPAQDHHMLLIFPRRNDASFLVARPMQNILYPHNSPYAAQNVALAAENDEHRTVFSRLFTPHPSPNTEVTWEQGDLDQAFTNFHHEPGLLSPSIDIARQIVDGNEIARVFEQAVQMSETVAAKRRESREVAAFGEEIELFDQAQAARFGGVQDSSDHRDDGFLLRALDPDFVDALAETSDTLAIHQKMREADQEAQVLGEVQAIIDATGSESLSSRGEFIGIRGNEINHVHEETLGKAIGVPIRDEDGEVDDSTFRGVIYALPFPVPNTTGDRQVLLIAPTYENCRMALVSPRRSYEKDALIRGIEDATSEQEFTEFFSPSARPALFANWKPGSVKNPLSEFLDEHIGLVPFIKLDRIIRGENQDAILQFAVDYARRIKASVTGNGDATVFPR